MGTQSIGAAEAGSPNRSPGNRALRGLAGAAAAWSSLRPALHEKSLTATQVALGVVFVWFGLLKAMDSTPVAHLVEQTIPWGVPSWFVPCLGVVEVVLGVWLASGRGLQFALPIFLAHMLGTLGVLVMAPQEAYQHGNPMLLTVTGEFVVKNLILIAAGTAVATRRVTRPQHRPSGDIPADARPDRHPVVDTSVGVPVHAS